MPLVVVEASTLTELAGSSDVAVAKISTTMDADLWPAFCTNTGPVMAFVGTVAVSEVAVAVFAVTETLPPAPANTTVLFAAFELNPDPVRVIEAPTAARVGETDVNEIG